MKKLNQQDMVTAKHLSILANVLPLIVTEKVALVKWRSSQT